MIAKPVPSQDTTTVTHGALINSATAKATPVDADMIGLMDSAASNILKKLSWANLKTTIFASPTIVTPTIASIIGNKIYPAADSTTAIQILKADGTTPVVTVDTTNKRIGINLSDPVAKFEVSGEANILGILRITQRATGAVAYGLDIGLDPSTGAPVFSGIYNNVLIESFRIDRQNGNTGFRGITSPTAAIHLPAGTTVANTAPLQFTSGPVETVKRAGLVEYNGRYVVTESDAANRYLVQAAASTKTTAGAPFVNDGHVSMTINGTTHNFMTTA